jgi:hypothetical protein
MPVLHTRPLSVVLQQRLLHLRILLLQGYQVITESHTFNLLLSSKMAGGISASIVRNTIADPDPEPHYFWKLDPDPL